MPSGAAAELFRPTRAARPCPPNRLRDFVALNDDALLYSLHRLRDFVALEKPTQGFPANICGLRAWRRLNMLRTDTMQLLMRNRTP